MRPRPRRLVIDDTRPPPPPAPRWIDIHREEIVERTLYLLRNHPLPYAEKERRVREGLERDEDD